MILVDLGVLTLAVVVMFVLASVRKGLQKVCARFAASPFYMLPTCV